MKKMGFKVNYMEDGTAKGVLNLREEELMKCPEPTTAAEPTPPTEALSDQKVEPGKPEAALG
jgi:hypothetical protein